MANRINSFADAMTGWLAEYAQKQQVSCGNGDVNRAVLGSGALVIEPAGIHLVPEPPAIPEEPEWSDGMTSLEQYKDQGVKL